MAEMPESRQRSSSVSSRTRARVRSGARRSGRLRRVGWTAPRGWGWPNRAKVMKRENMVVVSIERLRMFDSDDGPQSERADRAPGPIEVLCLRRQLITEGAGNLAPSNQGAGLFSTGWARQRAGRLRFRALL